MCENRMVLGVSCGDYRRHGAFAEYVAVPRRITYKLPDSLPFEHAALIEAVSVAVHAANRTPIQLGDSCVVVGTGMIGLLAVQAVKLAGCSKVIAIDLDDDRLRLAKKLGATHAINGKSENVVEQVHAMTSGRGADCTLEVVGSTPTVKLAIDCTRKAGKVTLVGNLAPNVEVPLQAIVTRELDVLGSCASCGEYPACIDLMESGAIKVADLITAKTSLEDCPDWFSRLYEGEPGAMKVLVCPNDES